MKNAIHKIKSFFSPAAKQNSAATAATGDKKVNTIEGLNMAMELIKQYNQMPLHRFVKEIEKSTGKKIPTDVVNNFATKGLPNTTLLDEDYLKEISGRHSEPKPMRPYMCEINTGAGMRKMRVEADSQRNAELTALGEYMKTYFKVKTYPLPYFPKQEAPATDATNKENL